jgi:hypothetical protein
VYKILHESLLGQQVKVKVYAMDSSNSNNNMSEASTSSSTEQINGLDAKVNESTMNNLEASVIRMLENQRR